VQTGRAAYQRRAETRRQHRVLGGGSRRAELDRDIAAAQQLLGIVAGRGVVSADAGQLAEALTDGGAAAPDDPARQRASGRRDDVGDQHAANPAGASDHPDPGVRHRRLRIASVWRRDCFVAALLAMTTYLAVIASPRVGASRRPRTG